MAITGIAATTKDAHHCTVFLHSADHEVHALEFGPPPETPVEPHDHHDKLHKEHDKHAHNHAKGHEHHEKPVEPPVVELGHHHHVTKFHSYSPYTSAPHVLTAPTEFEPLTSKWSYEEFLHELKAERHFHTLSTVDAAGFVAFVKTLAASH